MSGANEYEKRIRQTGQMYFLWEDKPGSNIL